MVAPNGTSLTVSICHTQIGTDRPYKAGSISWAQRLKRVLNIDITQCERRDKHNVRRIASLLTTQRLKITGFCRQTI
ncbi:MAG: hypothetical protein ACI808_000097 [Paraglaciecola sp.]|jgi:hypothetical protein